MLEPGAKQVVEVEGTLSEDASYNDVRADAWPPFPGLTATSARPLGAVCGGAGTPVRAGRLRRVPALWGGVREGV